MCLTIGLVIVVHILAIRARPQMCKCLVHKFQMALRTYDLQGAHVVESISSAMELLKNFKSGGRLEHIFIIGGGQVYAEAVELPQCSAVHLTAVSSFLSQNANSEAAAICEISASFPLCSSAACRSHAEGCITNHVLCRSACGRLMAHPQRG